MIYIITIISIVYIYYVIKMAIQKDDNKISDNLKNFKDDKRKN
jgi:hypothetical protein